MNTSTHVSHLLDDYIDGWLDDADRTRVRAHVESCARCAAELERLTSLLAAAKELPAAVDPPRDLWVGIERRITPLPIPVARERSIGRRWARIGLTGVAVAAAAVALVVIGLSHFLTESGPVASSVDRSIAPAHVASLVRALDVQCMGAGKQLVAMSGSGTLTPETAESVRQSVALLDSAITDTRAALANDPNRSELLHHLMASYEQKLSLLHRATRLAGEA
jgi:anti-sigma factor RsiW